MGPITAARQALGDVLTDDPALAGFTVWPYAQAVDVPTEYTLVLNTARVTPGPTAVDGLTVLVDVWLIEPGTEPGDTDDGLEDALALVLSALDAAGIEWNTAEPAVWRDTNPAYRIETEHRT